jgi:hypothetical protein
VLFFNDTYQLKIRHVIKYALTTITFLFALNSHADNRTDTVVRQFYDWRLKASFTGVPDEAMLKKANQFLTPELTCLLALARNYRDLHVQHFPTDKPPFIEGDMFSSVFEGANRYKVESVQVNKNGTTARVNLHLYLDQSRKKDNKGWRDTVLVQKKNEGWLISDIHYNGRFNFGNNGSLRKNLLDELSVDNEELHWQGKKQVDACR